MTQAIRIFVLSLHTIDKFNPTEVQEIRSGCEDGSLGCVDCKTNCAKMIIDELMPNRDKRAYYESHMDEVKRILADGEERARAIARHTMSEVHEAMKIG